MDTGNRRARRRRKAIARSKKATIKKRTISRDGSDFERLERYKRYQILFRKFKF